MTHKLALMGGGVVFLLNAPRRGGNHIPDPTASSQVFSAPTTA